MVVDHLHGHLGDTGVVAHVAGDTDRLSLGRGQPGHVAVPVDVSEQIQGGRGHPEHPREVAQGTRFGRHAVEDGQQRVPLAAAQWPQLDEAAVSEPDGHDVVSRPV